MNKILFITGNKFKFELAKSKLNLNAGIELEQKKFPCIEIQANTIGEIASYSAKYCADNVNSPCIKNDSGLSIISLDGFPGPYTRYVEEKIKEGGILDLMSNISNRKAEFIEVLAFCEPGKESILFECKTEGEISTKIMGEYGWGIDKIFIPRGYNKTFAEFNDEERMKLWDSSGYNKLSEYLNKLYINV